MHCVFLSKVREGVPMVVSRASSSSPSSAAATPATADCRTETQRDSETVRHTMQPLWRRYITRNSSCSHAVLMPCLTSVMIEAAADERKSMLIHLTQRNTFFNVNVRVKQVTDVEGERERGKRYEVGGVASASACAAADDGRFLDI